MLEAGDCRNRREKGAEGGRSGPLAAESDEGKGLVALGEAPAVGIADERVVEIIGNVQVEKRLQKAVDVGRGKQVVTAGDVGDLLGGVIDNDGKMVGCADILACQDHVPEKRRVNGLHSMKQIIECQRAGDLRCGRCVQSPTMGGASGNETGAPGGAQ